MPREQQIVAAPKWLTAYLAAGEAYAHLGDKQKALQRLRYVVEHAGNDSAYKSDFRHAKRTPCGVIGIQSGPRG